MQQTYKSINDIHTKEQSRELKVKSRIVNYTLNQWSRLIYLSDNMRVDLAWERDPSSRSELARISTIWQELGMELGMELGKFIFHSVWIWK